MIGLSESLGSWGNENGYIQTVLAVALVSFSMASSLRLKYSLVLKVKQSVNPIGALDINVTALSAVPAARSASGYELLSSKGNAAVASASSNHFYLCTIYEHLPCLRPAEVAR
jgi:hypothetical protein